MLTTGPDDFLESACIAHRGIRVALGIVKDRQGKILVTRRNPNSHLGGRFEFPGGKLEGGESPKAALKRELKEELNLELRQCQPLIQIPYSYPDMDVFLDVFLVTEFTGNPCGNEMQTIYWKEISELENLDFPDANHGIIRALQLPRLISVTPSVNQNPAFLQHFERTVKQERISVIHLRSHELDTLQYLRLAKTCLEICQQHLTRLVLNSKPEFLEKIDAAGLHLTSRRLLATHERPLGKDYLVSASCHDLGEVRHASGIGLDYIFLGPVLEKTIITGASPLGWRNFFELAQRSSIPVYAIGGLGAFNIDSSIGFGGQGVAAIRDVWK